MPQPLISIVVPVYNEQENIKQCLDSICHQTLGIDQVEVIIVDDESTDGSREIINTYTSQYDNFRLVENARNIGLGLSRNEGMKQASGRFLMFLDSDDWLDIRALSVALPILHEENPDLLIFNHSSVYHDGFTVPQTPTGLTRDNPLEPFRFSREDFEIVRSFHVAWNKIFKKTWADSIPLSYPKGNYEDLGCTYIALMEAASICTIPQPIHNYRQHPQSRPGRPNRKSQGVRHQDVFTRYESVFSYMEENNLLDEFGGLIYAKMLNQYISIFCERLNPRYHDIVNFRTRLYDHARRYRPADPVFFSIRDKVIFNLVKIRCLWLLKVIFYLKSAVKR